MNAADYLYEQLMDAHQRIRDLESDIDALRLHIQLSNVKPVIMPKRGRGRPKKEQSNEQ